MNSCFCSLAGTAACRTCANNPNAETPPPVRTYTTWATDKVMITGVHTNADRIRSMTDEELATLLTATNFSKWAHDKWLGWLREEVKDGDSG